MKAIIITTLILIIAAPAFSQSAHEYWRDRQYADRIRAEERQHELKIERIRAQTEIEVAKQRRKSRPSGYYYPYPRYRSYNHVDYGQPEKRPELKGSIYSTPSGQKRVGNAIK